MISSKFSNILLNTLPKKINNISEDILDFLFDINEVVRELNSIDFCNPLGYILTKALPPGGVVDKQLKEYGNKVKKFNNIIYNKIDNPNNQLLLEDIEEIRLSLEELIIPEQLKDIIPGADGITNVIQSLNDSLTSTSISLIDKKLLLRSFTKRLIPLSNPSTIVEALISNETDNLNRKLNNLIKPERFREELLRLIKLTNRINKSILQIENVMIIMSKIIKSINSLLKIIKLSVSILKKIPVPAKLVTVGIAVTASTKVSRFEVDIDNLSKILVSISTFLDKTIITQITRIRNEIFILLIGLNQLYENLSKCIYFENDILLSEVQDAIDILNNNISILENLFPTIKIDEDNLDLNYKGYTLFIDEEKINNNPTSLFRKRIIVTNKNNIIEYEGTPTFSNNKQLLIKEGYYYIDKKGGILTFDKGNNELNEQETQLLLSQIGYNASSLKEASEQEEEAQKLLINQINNNADDKILYDKYINNDENKINKVQKIIELLYKQNNNPLVIKNKITSVRLNLLKKGYSPKIIEDGIKRVFKQKKNIIIENNNITLK